MCLERKSRVRRITPPPESVVAGWYENASLLDSYSIDLSSSKHYSIRVLATRTVGDPPAWIKALLAVRDAMVTPFGVKTSDEVRASRADNERVDFFPVQWESNDEIAGGRSGVGALCAAISFETAERCLGDLVVCCRTTSTKKR